MDDRLLGLLSQITSTTSMAKMGQIEGLIKEYEFAEGSTSELVESLCKFVMSNMDKKENVIRFVAHVIDAAVEAGPQMEKLLKENAETIASMLNKGDTDANPAG